LQFGYQVYPLADWNGIGFGKVLDFIAVPASTGTPARHSENGEIYLIFPISSGGGEV
jgi:hypothetical protein